MPLLATRLGRLQPSPTIAISQKARELRAAGRDILALSVGEPDFDTPPHIQDAAIAAIRSGQTRYTPVNGTLALREAIVEKFERENDLRYSLDEITVGCGGKQIIYNAFTATLQEGDEVLVPAPYWVSYTDIARVNGAEAILVECRAEDGFRLRPEALEAAITPRTKWLVLNSPCNPTGAAYGREEMRALTAVLLRHPHVWILTDDIYEKLVYDDFEFVTPAQVEPELASRTLTLNGLSKAFCMTGWRVGYAGGPLELIRAINMLTSQSTTNTSSISQAAAVAALRGPQDFIAEHNEAFQARRDFVVQRLDAMPGLECQKPEGAFYVFPSCQGVLGKSSPQGTRIETETDFVGHLLDAAEVAVVPGAAFGSSPHFRLSYAASMETLELAMDRIAAVCEALH